MIQPNPKMLTIEMLQLNIIWIQTRTIWGFYSTSPWRAIRMFHGDTKLTILALLPTFFCINTYIYSFLLYLHHMMLVNVELDVRGYKGISFQCWRFHWSSSILIAELKQIWQYWHSCNVERSWKTLLLNSQNRPACTKHHFG